MASALARELVAQFDHPAAHRRDRAQLHGGQRPRKQGLAGAQHDGDDGEVELVEQARRGELRGDATAADDPDVALARRARELGVTSAAEASTTLTSMPSTSGTGRSRELSTQYGLPA